MRESCFAATVLLYPFNAKADALVRSPFSGIAIDACPEPDPRAQCTYGRQHSRNKPLNHVYVEGISIELVQDQSLDAEGHCCGVERCLSWDS